MAPRGAAQPHATPGLDPTALITRLLLWLLLPAILPSISSLPVGDDSEFSNDDNRYYVTDNNIQCLRCPAGYYVGLPCTKPDSMGKCVPCPVGSYTEDFTGMSECLPCTRCRDDQDQVSACKSSKNTICHCKKGTYCAPNQPCEICLNCTPSCPEDQFPLAPCNATSDIQCGPQSGSTDKTTSIIVSAVVLLLILAIILVVVLMKRKKGSKLIGKIFYSVCKPGESEDSSAQLLPPAIMLQFKEDITADAKKQIMGRTFDVVVEHGPVKDFDKFMRKLGLTDSYIDRAKLENPLNVNDRHYAMLRMLHEEKPFDVNLILQTLRHLKMDTNAQTITSELLKEELYIQKVQS